MANRWKVLLAGLIGTGLVGIPTSFFLLACWHARTLDLGEKYGWTGVILVFAMPFSALASAAALLALDDR